ncbi:helix-turn-helix domain-containing protein [Streptomyces sp. NPDC059740]|uniref:helix-turn-helix domain-containing protein n=1 Tax=Streptomyces sp. NPDC059740 TaxID=3346926 RepID=UPI00364CB105
MEDRPWTRDAAALTGSRIRELRRERGLSLSELARRAGVGKATLSGLETGARNPTAETLYAVAGQLGVELTALLAVPGAAVTAAPEVRGAAVTATPLAAFRDAAAEGGTVTTELFRLRIRPGERQTSPAHGPGTVEYLTLFSGSVRVGPADAPLVVHAGEHVSWLSDRPHVYEALGGGTAEASLLIRHAGG